ncbi:YitT family protein [Thermoactinomyces sp. DSM 45892]|uniref:YitT family protein n=1 Tax=Thermoactinomyces sp. DSM 45892 TaxID=1882753 RepID=UPI000897E559|nr:YitT family protein [Thermoactinomyces sp. DSM 45892]SDY98114.1 Uncharacterized membrane-anchored protein YitT, contains DUF161 and DUF2179 domains [Thermoactinomyces sp. DSM 45892]
MKKQIYMHTRNILSILIGAFIAAVGINYFAIPNQLAEGGFTGIALLANYQFGLSPGWIILGLNIPLFFVGYRVFGKQTLFYTLIGTTSFSLFIEWTAGLGSSRQDVLLASLYTGVLVGIGLGLIFRVGGTTGGADIIARLMNKYFGWSMGKTMFIFDFFVILISSKVIGLDKAMYTLIVVFVGARVIDFVVEGLNASKAATIISNAAVLLADEITRKMGRGVTFLQGKGGYTGTEKNVIYIVLAPNQIPKLKQIVHNADPYAFMVIHDVRDVYGEGFSYEAPDKIEKNIKKEKK